MKIINQLSDKQWIEHSAASPSCVEYNRKQNYLSLWPRPFYIRTILYAILAERVQYKLL